MVSGHGTAGATSDLHGMRKRRLELHVYRMYEVFEAVLLLPWREYDIQRSPGTI